MSKIIVRHIGTAQWYLQNEGPEKRKLQKQENLLENVFFAVKCSILLRFVNLKKLTFANLSDKTNHMSKINVQLIGTAQWYLENDGPKKKEKSLEQNLSKCLFCF